MLVFDTSAFVNGRRDHYPVETFPSVWDFVAEAMEDGRIITPREVLNELKAKDDETCRWAKERTGCFVEPSAEVQRQAGEILAMLPNPGVRDGADPFVVAEARVRSFVVVTYEGRSFSGVPTKNWGKEDARNLPAPGCGVPHPARGPREARRFVLALSGVAYCFDGSLPGLPTSGLHQKLNQAVQVESGVRRSSRCPRFRRV